MSENIHLGDALLSIRGGGTPAKGNPSYWEGEIPWASVKDFADNQFYLNHTEDHITEYGLENSSSRLVEAGTPIICTRMAVGRSAIAAMNVAINQDLKALVVRPEILEPKYLVRSLHFYQETLERISVGSTVKGITLDQIRGLSLFVPSLAEQKAIATILDTLDDAIQSTEAMLTKQEKIKQGLLQDLLTKGVDQSGKLKSNRVHDQDDYKVAGFGYLPHGWEFLPIGQVVVDVRGGAAIKSDEFSDSGIGVIAKSDVTTDKFIDIESREQYVSHRVSKRYPQSMVDSGAVIVSLRDLVPSGPTVGMASVFYGEGEYLLAQGTYGFYLDKSKMLPQFFVEVTRQAWFRQLVKEIVVGSTQVHVRSSEYLNLKVVVPPLKEQQQIQILISQCDELGRECKLMNSKLTDIKSALMQDLLTGRRRVTPELIDQINQLTAEAA